jgi:seryl-tRNA synthetase
MLDIKLIRQNPDVVRKALSDRGGRYLPAYEEFLTADARALEAKKEVEPLQARRNKAADEIGKLKREKQDVSLILKEMEELKGQIKSLEEKASALDAEAQEKMLGLPNIPDASVPLGTDAAQNPVVREWGTKPSFSFVPKDHQEVGDKLALFDFGRAAKLSGARFSLLTGWGARLERALIQFMLDLHTKEHGYTEVMPPYLVTRQTMTGTGQLPKFSEELYATQDDLFLIPTAEVPVTNLFRDETLDEDRFPLAVTAYTACFRREAGAAGKDTRGLIRNHQFNKVELVRFVKPEDHLAELEKLTAHAEEVLKRLGLAHRRVALVTGDIGFSSAKTYDLEVWMPGDRSADPKNPGCYREISSCSTFTDFQARRIGIRLKRKDGSKTLVYTLNGSGVAVGRTMAAILENGQQADGSVVVPEALRPYLGADRLVPQKPL